MTRHGLLLVNKPSGMTSHDVVGRVRRALKMREVGHAGTLDPLASGLMVLLLGEGTKLSDFVLNGDKSYRVKVKLGMRTDSLDITGQVLSHVDALHDPETVAKCAEALRGEFTWQVPIFSAVKTGGKKLYELAHAGRTPEEVPFREMRFWDVQVYQASSSSVEANLTCSKGSFVRTWAAELGERLGSGGVVETLERTFSDPYRLEEAVSLTQIEENIEQLEAWSAFVPLHRALPHWKTLTVSGKDERLIHNGQISFDLERRLIHEQKDSTRRQTIIGIKILSAESGQLLAILEARPGQRLKIRRVFKMT